MISEDLGRAMVQEPRRAFSTAKSLCPVLVTFDILKTTFCKCASLTRFWDSFCLLAVFWKFLDLDNLMIICRHWSPFRLGESIYFPTFHFCMQCRWFIQISCSGPNNANGGIARSCRWYRRARRRYNKYVLFFRYYDALRIDTFFSVRWKSA